jgi:hypothetical protein
MHDVSVEHRNIKGILYFHYHLIFYTEWNTSKTEDVSFASCKVKERMCSSIPLVEGNLKHFTDQWAPLHFFHLRMEADAFSKAF